MSQGMCSIAVLSWPDALPELDRVEAVVRAVGLDPLLAAQAVRKPPPMVLARLPISESAAAVQALVAVGAGPLLVADDDIARLPEAILAKRLVPALGAPSPMYQVEPWRAGPVKAIGLDCSRVVLIIRAKLVSKRVGRWEQGPDRGSSMAHEMLSWHGPVASLLRDEGDGPSIRKVAVKTAHVIDLWTLNPGPEARLGPGLIGHLRIHGDKFSWDVLNHLKAHGDHSNADRLALLLAEQCTRAQVDLGFTPFADASARTLGRSYRSMGNGAEKTEQGPIFEFYSAWSMIRVLKLGYRPPSPHAPRGA